VARAPQPGAGAGGRHGLQRIAVPERAAL
jgi:hypothetical protein